MTKIEPEPDDTISFEPISLSEKQLTIRLKWFIAGLIVGGGWVIFWVLI